MQRDPSQTEAPLVLLESIQVGAQVIVQVEKKGSSGGSVQALKKVDVLAQSVVGSITLFRLE
ncbi:MAG: hypothetical protein ABSH35_33985, partial [Isosphaeraceae bacterium]